jgi:two-component system chemotaxis response regulator CheY
MGSSVLIVDDSPSMRKVIRRVIQLSGFDARLCLEAGDGVEALQLLDTEHVDIVLTDINMPNMDGEQLLTRLISHPAHCRIPVIVVSTDRSEGRVERMMAMGARGYVVKPFVPQTLGDTLFRLIEERA